MKKIFFILITIVLLISFSACNIEFIVPPVYEISIKNDVEYNYFHSNTKAKVFVNGFPIGTINTSDNFFLRTDVYEGFNTISVEFLPTFFVETEKRFYERTIYINNDSYLSINDIFDGMDDFYRLYLLSFENDIKYFGGNYNTKVKLFVNGLYNKTLFTGESYSARVKKGNQNIRIKYLPTDFYPEEDREYTSTRYVSDDNTVIKFSDITLTDISINNTDFFAYSETLNFTYAEELNYEISFKNK